MSKINATKLESELKRLRISGHKRTNPIALLARQSLKAPDRANAPQMVLAFYKLRKP